MILHTTNSNWEHRLFAMAQDSRCKRDEASTRHPAPVDDQDLTDAVAYCEAITARYSRSFYQASGLLNNEKRRAIRVLYAFCRTADNLADDPIENPVERLREMRRSLAGQELADAGPVLNAWRIVRQRYQIPLCYAEQLLDGVESDLFKRRFPTFEDLSLYCYEVASTVGLMSMHIIGFNSPQAVPHAIKLGVALQITNILRDVREDWIAGRLYLPMEDLERFHIGPHDLEVACVDERWRQFMRFQISRARQLYEEALPGIAMLSPDGRFAVAAAAFLYRGILDDIEACGYDVFSRRAHVNNWKKMFLLAQAFAYAAKNRMNGIQ